MDYILRMKHFAFLHRPCFLLGFSLEFIALRQARVQKLLCPARVANRSPLKSNLSTFSLNQLVTKKPEQWSSAWKSSGFFCPNHQTTTSCLYGLRGLHLSTSFAATPGCLLTTTFHSWPRWLFHDEDRLWMKPASEPVKTLYSHACRSEWLY